MLFGAANDTFLLVRRIEKAFISLLFLPVCTNFAPTTVYKQ